MSLWKKIWWVLGAIGTLSTLATLAAHETKRIEITAPVAAVANPFDVHFTFTNPTWFVGFESGEVLCSLRQFKAVRATGGPLQISIENSAFEDRAEFTLAPGEKKLVSCDPMRTIMVEGGVNVQQTKLVILTRYHRWMGNDIERLSEFSWNARSEVWETGEVVP